mmetsp:Transcript_5063/g.16658  ORF Transcript_5063/g.16658 Transcript_5063/m.16658 type:complete len:224 (+) Transcript_5063:129-800(+)
MRNLERCGSREGPPQRLGGVRERAAREGRLGHHAGKCKHREPAVRDLLLEHGFELLGRAAQVEGVEVKVARAAVRLARHHLGDGVVRDRLDGADGEEQAEHRPRLDGRVVRSERRDVRRKRDVEAVVDSDVPNPSEHADAPVLQLGLTHPLDVEGAGEVERVEPLVASHAAVEGSRRIHEGQSLRLHAHRRRRRPPSAHSRQAGVEGEAVDREREHVCSSPAK